MSRAKTSAIDQATIDALIESIGHGLETKLADIARASSSDQALILSTLPPGSATALLDCGLVEIDRRGAPRLTDLGLAVVRRADELQREADPYLTGPREEAAETFASIGKSSEENKASERKETELFA